MNLKERTGAFVQLGLFIKRHYEGRNEAELQLHLGLEKVIELAYLANGWFSPNFVNEAIRSIGKMLEAPAVEAFAGAREAKKQKTVALICAGNIPLVGFHDLMCILISGHKVLLKLSSDDNVLMPFFIRLLTHLAPGIEEQIAIADGKISNFDAVIATGSNNTAAHFEYYFSKYPNIIRKNRTSLAVLDGSETEEELKQLGRDIFLYYGLGCRNVGKLIVPVAYVFNRFFECMVDYGYVIDNKKYANNYDYHRAIYLLEQQQFLDNNFLMLKQSQDLHSPVATLYYDFYKDKKEADLYLESHQSQLQCVVGHGFIPFGYSQQPVITEFADNINTLEFLLSLG